MTNELLTREDGKSISGKAVIHEIYRISNGGTQRIRQHELIIYDKDPSIIEVEVIIK